MEIALNEQRVFVVETYFRTNSYKKVKEAFSDKFSEKAVPSKSSIERNVKKYRNHAMSINRNKENSGRKRSARTVENIEAVRALLERNPRVCARDNGLLTKSSFNRITKRDLKFHPYHMYLDFCEWFSGQNTRFLPNFVISDEANFAMNGVVNTWNVRKYAPKGQPPEDFFYDRNESRKTIMVWGGMW